MINNTNPFQFEAANSLPPQQLIEFFIEDNNFSRFVRSNRNIFLVGERGSGKTMNLLYHSIKIQKIIAEEKNIDIDFNYIGIFMPCSSPLYQRPEYQLFESEIVPIIISENIFIIDIAFNIIKSISILKDNITIDNPDDLLKNIKYILGIDLPDNNDIFECLIDYFQKQCVEYQKKPINDLNIDKLTSWSFYSLIIPLFNILRKIKELNNTHFMLMIDDVQYLNEHQRKILNGLISYRDNSLFSCKIATPKINKVDMTTSSGGTILEGHDYLKIDMVQPFQNRANAFALFAKEVIEKRIKIINNKIINAEDFFPQNPQFKKDIEESNEKTRQEAIIANPEWTTKQITDYVYKYGRAKYFRDRAIKANIPPFSGFEIITHLSTGVIRNLLNPCYWMFDRVISNKKDNSPIEFIPSNIQTEVINAESIKLWNELDDGLECKVHGCTEEQSEAIKYLFEKLYILFKYRLLNHISEPRAVVFTISGLDREAKKIILPLLDIAQKANLLYERMSRAKDDGLLEKYYTPNRMLWPSVGLDPQGQHARVSLKARDIIAATKGIDFPVDNSDDYYTQGELFNE